MGRERARDRQTDRQTDRDRCCLSDKDGSHEVQRFTLNAKISLTLAIAKLLFL